MTKSLFANCLLFIKKYCNTLRDETRGSILIEFALMAPIFILVGFGGYELNAAKKQSLHNNTVASSISSIMSVYGGFTTENQMTELMTKAPPIIGSLPDFVTNGYVVITAVASDGHGGTKILWQRCAGGNTHPSKHTGTQTTMANGQNIGADYTGVIVESWYHYKNNSGIFNFNTNLYSEISNPIRDNAFTATVIDDHTGAASSSTCT